MTHPGKTKPRTIGWFSCGVASAVAIKLTLDETPGLVPTYCETGAEHSDNERFLTDCEKWFGKSIKRLRSEKYISTWDVWARRKYLAGIKGAPCSVEMKIVPRLAFQHPSDLHVFGYTADPADLQRYKRFQLNHPELQVRAPLVEHRLTKDACHSMIQSCGIRLPRMYELGFKNNNCIPCVKATSPAYWSLIRRHFPDHFERMAKLSRQLGARLSRINNERIFIDEIPLDYPTSRSSSRPCDFLCHAGERSTSL